MKTFKLDSMIRGWFIGDFEPSILKVKNFEVGILEFKKGHKKPPHYHKISTEYNVLLSGNFTTNGIHFKEGDIFIIQPNEIVDPEFHTDCRILCVKVPSAPNDKYEDNE
jgi:quercetin dioxygenase-like cupin family protein